MHRQIEPLNKTILFLADMKCAKYRITAVIKVKIENIVIL